MLAQKRENEKKRYEKIMRNPELYAEYKRKNKEKYQRRKREGKVVTINNLPPREQRNKRKKDRESGEMNPKGHSSEEKKRRWLYNVI